MQGRNQMPLPKRDEVTRVVDYDLHQEVRPVDSMLDSVIDIAILVATYTAGSSIAIAGAYFLGVFQ